MAVNDSFVALTPFWAVWPFEVLIVSRRPFSGLDRMSLQERDDLAAALKSVTTRYDNLFEVSFPYTMGFHQRPAGDESPFWHFHAHYYPPLLRSAMSPASATSASPFTPGSGPIPIPSIRR